MNPDDLSFYDTRTKMGVPRRVLQYHEIAMRRVKDNIMRNFQLGRRQALYADVLMLVDLTGEQQLEYALSYPHDDKSQQLWTRELIAETIMESLDIAYVRAGDPLGNVREVLDTLPALQPAVLDEYRDMTIRVSQDRLAPKPSAQPELKRAKLDE